MGKISPFPSGIDAHTKNCAGSRYRIFAENICSTSLLARRFLANFAVPDTRRWRHLTATG